MTRALDAARALEVGTHLGHSTLHIAAALADNGPECRLRTVDRSDVNDETVAHYREFGSDISAAQRIARAGLGDRVTFTVANSSEFLRDTDETYDFMFIDGDHSEVGAYFDIVHALSCLRDGGVMLLHDFHDPDDPDPEHSYGQYGVFWALRLIQRHAPGITVHRLRFVVPSPDPTEPPTSIALLTRAG